MKGGDNMITAGEVKDILSRAGVKHKKLAEATGIHKTWVSEFINNRISRKSITRKIELFRKMS